MGGYAGSGDHTGNPELSKNRVSQGRPSRAIPIRNVSSSAAQRPEESRKAVTFCRILYTCTPREAPGGTPADRR
jgi:hypothetical protein